MEPERKIEKLLQAYAKRRREEAGPPMELDPATRRLLQSEAARQAPKAGDRGFFAGLFAMLRARPVLLGSGAAIIVLCAITLPLVLNRAKPERSLASVRSDDLESPKQLRAPAVPPPATAPDRDSWTGKRETRESEMVLDDKVKDVSVTVAPGGAVNSPGTKLGSGANRSQLEEQLKSAQPTVATSGGGGGGGFGAGGGAPTATPTAPTTTVGGELDRAEVASRRAFSAATVTGVAGSNLQIATAERSRSKDQFDTAAAPGDAVSIPLLAGRGGASATKAPGRPAEFASGNYVSTAVPAANARAQRFVESTVDSVNEVGRSNTSPVLASFTVEQNGRDLRLVDRDGSVYIGSFQPATVSGELPAAPVDAFKQNATDAATVLLEKKADASAQNFFRVTGTNQTLNQNVVFSGYLFTLTNGFAFADGTNAPASTATAAPVSFLQSSLIRGSVQINNSRPVPFQATSAPAMQR